MDTDLEYSRSLAFISDVASHLEGWTLQTGEDEFARSRRAELVNDQDPNAAIVAVPPQWSNPDHWTFHARTSLNPDHTTWVPNPPKSIRAASRRGPEAIARDVARRLVLDALDYAKDVAERVTSHQRRVAVSDAAIIQIGEHLPQASLNFGSLGSASLYHHTTLYECISAEFRLDHGTVTLRGLSPEQQVAIAKALAGILDEAPAYYER